MTEAEKRLYYLINANNAPINSIASYPQTKEQALNFDLAKYLGLKGGLWGGQYSIEPKKPEQGMFPVKMMYSMPMLQGDLSFRYENDPIDRSFFANYMKRF